MTRTRRCTALALSPLLCALLASPSALAWKGPICAALGVLDPERDGSDAFYRHGAAPGGVWWLSDTRGRGDDIDDVWLTQPGRVFGPAAIVMVGPSSVALRVPADLAPGIQVQEELLYNSLSVVERQARAVPVVRIGVPTFRDVARDCDVRPATFGNEDIVEAAFTITTDEPLGDEDVLLDAWMVPRGSALPDERAARVLDSSLMLPFVTSKDETSAALRFSLIDPGEWDLHLRFKSTDTGELLASTTLSVTVPAGTSCACVAPGASRARAAAAVLVVLALAVGRRRRGQGRPSARNTTRCPAIATSTSTPGR